MFHLHSTDSDDKEQLDHEERRQQIDERRARNRAQVWEQTERTKFG